MNLHDNVPVGFSHLDKRFVSKDTSVVDKDVNLAISVDGSLDNLVAELNRVVVGNSLTTGSLDLIDNLVGDSGSSLTYAKLVTSFDFMRRGKSEKDTYRKQILRGR